MKILTNWRLKILLLLLIVPAFVSATHIVGGSLTYEHISGATYRITVKLYRDCKPGNAAFPNPLTVEVRNGLNGNTFSPTKNVSIPLTSTYILDPPIDTCAFNPGICVQEAIYTKIVNNLPPNLGGYHLYYGFCCRNGTITNLTNPLSQTESFYTYIPDNNIYLTNSSPQWKNYTPVFICQGQQLTFDHGATDKDGDSLVYSLYRPFQQGPTWGPWPNFPTFPLVNYAGAYTYLDPLDPAQMGNFGLDPQTGVFFGVPPILGQFVVGVKCTEYRNGQLLNTIYRDFQFNVVNCPPIPIADIGPVNACAGTTIQFDNQSVPLNNNSFYWDFGDGSPPSTQINPTHTYPGLGTYTIMLIAQYGTPCADTVYKTITLSWANADFTYSDSTCVNTIEQFLDASTTAPGSSINSWQWNFGNGNTSNTQNPTNAWSVGGTYNVTLIVSNTDGCVDTVTKNMFIQAMPKANAGIDTFSCISNPIINLNGSVQNCGGGIWQGAGTFIPNNTTLNAGYNPTPGELSNGFAQLILFTTQNGFCPGHSDTVIINYTTGIEVTVGPDLFVCKDSTNIPISGTVVTATGGQWSTSGTGYFLPNSFALNGFYMPSSADTAAGWVMLILNSIGNGNCVPDADTLFIYFSSTPSVNILSGDTACAGTQLIPISATSTTGTGYWTTNGDGYFTPDDSLLITNYVAGSNDNTNGYVTLYFTSTGNGGCKAQVDSVTILLIPPPIADFSFISVCPRDSLFFSDSTTSSAPIVGWSWNFGDGNTSNLQNPFHLYGSSGIYNVTLIVTSSNGCVDSVTKQVEVYPFPNANFGVDGICVDVESQFNDSTTIGSGSIASWYWTFGDGSNSTSQNPIHTYANSGTYTVTLIVTSIHGCSDTITKTIFINPPPVADFESSPASVKVFEKFSFTDKSYDDIMAWFWDFGDNIGTSNEQNPQYGYASSGNFTVCLRVTDIAGCEDSVCKEVIVFMPPSVPNALSPNGDGVNDILYVLGGPFKELEFNIYNNWGELIFTSNDQKYGWDGKRKGVEQPLGVYVYTVKATTLDDVKHEIKGDVTLLR